MISSSKNTFKNLLKKHQISLLKRLGQNFLIDKGAVKKVAKTAELQAKDIVLEIGPGLGIITQELAKKAKKVIAVEKDLNMCMILKKTLKDFKNIKIIQKDILNYTLNVSPYKIVANLPFYITAPVIRKFLESKYPPKEMILITQKEVAQRICSKSIKMNILAVSVQFFSKPKIISYISKKSFWPQPKVDSAILKISQIRQNLPKTNINLFFKIVKAGFSHPRKQLVNNLSKELKLNKERVKFWLLKNKIQPKQRAETLSINNWVELTETFKAN